MSTSTLNLCLHGLPLAESYLIGVSGGRDSMCLLYALHQLGYKQLIITHVDHQLRGEHSDADRHLVESTAAKLGYDCKVLQTDVAAIAAAQKLSLEAAARQVRHEFWQQLAAELGIPQLILAHHAEDQAETLLMNLLRGTGINGLAAMRPHSEFGILQVLRPMLKARRSEIDTFLHTHAIPFHDDNSNADTQFTRNRIRHALLPQLCAAMQRDVVPQLLSLADIADREDDYLDQQSHYLLATCLQSTGQLQLKPELLSAHTALQHRVIQLWLQQSHDLGQLHAQLITEAVRLLEKAEPARLNLPTDLQLRRKSGVLSVVALK
jgi:tRNA(Ile)-lysidine synthase